MMRKIDALAEFDARQHSKLYMYSDYFKYYTATKRDIVNRYPWKDQRMFECLEDCLGSTRLFFDIDGKSDVSEEQFVRQLGQFLGIVKSICQQTFQQSPEFVVGRSPPKIKDGHQQFSYRVLCDRPIFSSKLDLVTFILKIKSDVDSPISDNVDVQVYKGSHVRMMFATKPNELRVQLPTRVSISDTESSLMPSSGSSKFCPKFFKKCFVKTKKQGLTLSVPSAIPKIGRKTYSISGGNYQLSDMEKWLWSSSISTSVAPAKVLVKLVESQGHPAICMVPSDETALHCLVTPSTKHSSPKSCLILTRDGRCRLKCFSPKHADGRSTDESGDEQMSSWYKYLKMWLMLSSPEKLGTPIKWMTDDIVRISSDVFPEFDIRTSDGQWKDVVIRSNMKTSKSTSCRRLLSRMWEVDPTLRVIFVVHRRTLGWHLKEKCDAVFGKDKVAFYLDAQKLDGSCIVSVDSLHRLDIGIQCDILVLDEIESLVPQLFSATSSLDTKAKNAKVWNHLLTTSTSCIVMDAELSEASEKMMMTLRPHRHRTFFINDSKNWRDVQAILVQTDAQLLAMMASDVAGGKKVYACFGSKKFMRHRALPILLQEVDSSKVMVYDSDTDASIKETHLKNVDDYWTKFDVILTTSTNHSGTSFEKPHFDAVYGFFGSAFNMSHEDMLQMMGRIRIVNRWNISIAFGSVKQSADTESISFDVSSQQTPFQQAELHTMWKQEIKASQAPSRFVSRLYQMGFSLSLATFAPPSLLIDIRQHLNRLAADIREEEANELSTQLFADEEEWTRLLENSRLGIVTQQERLSIVANDIYRYYDIRSFETFDAVRLCKQSYRIAFANRAIMATYSTDNIVHWDQLIDRLRQEELHRQRLIPDSLYLKSLHSEWIVLKRVLSLIGDTRLWNKNDFATLVYQTIVPEYRAVEKELKMSLFLHPKLFHDSNGRSMRKFIDSGARSQKIPSHLVGNVIKKIGWKIIKTKTQVYIKEGNFPPIPHRSISYWMRQL